MSLPKLPPNAALPSFSCYPSTSSPQPTPSFPITPSRPVAIAAAAAVAAAAAAAAATAKTIPTPPDSHSKLPPPPHPMWQNSALMHPMYPYLPNYTNDLANADLLSFLYPPITPNPMLINVPAAPMDRNVPVLVNVGGSFYTVPLSLLLSLPESALAKIFRGRFSALMLDGATFLDRDGAMFKYVIEFLRTKTVQLDNMLPREVKQLRREFNYFGLKLVEDSPSTAYVAGGKRAPLTCSTVERYDIHAKCWVTAPSLITPRYANQLCVASQFKALFAIGGANHGAALSSVEKFDLTTQKWQEVAPMLTPRKRHAACVLGDFIYVAGGFGADNKELASVEKYDITRDLWISLAPMPHAVAGGGLLAIGADLIFIPSSFLSPFHYSMSNNVWGKVASMLVSRMGCGVCGLNGKVYAIGGYGGPEGHLKDVEVYDPLTNTWEMSVPMQQPRAYPGVFVLGGRIHVVGGQSRAATGNLGVELSSIECFDPATNQWSYVTPLPTPRSHLGACVACDQVDLFERRLAPAGQHEVCLAPAPRPPPLEIPQADEDDEDLDLTDYSDLDEERGPEPAPPVWAHLNGNAGIGRKGDESKRRRSVPPVSNTSRNRDSARLLMSINESPARSRSSRPVVGTASLEAAVALLMTANNVARSAPLPSSSVPSPSFASASISSDPAPSALPELRNEPDQQ